MAIELEAMGLPFKREMEMVIRYKGIGVGQRRVDFLVDEKIMVELKAVSKLDEIHQLRPSTIWRHINSRSDC